MSGSRPYLILSLSYPYLILILQVVVKQIAQQGQELGLPWLNAHYFRIGASGLLGDISRQLEHYLSGRYSASYRHPMG